MKKTSSSKLKRNEKVTKNEYKIKSIDELKRLIISNRDDKKNYFIISKQRFIQHFLNSLILLSSSLTTTR
jgi:hypothetical protein